MQTNKVAAKAKNGLSLVVGRREVPKELIERALWVVAHSDLQQFGMAVETAREIWRSHRELVEAPEMPVQLEALIRLDGYWCLGTEEMAGFRGELMAHPALGKIVAAFRENTMAAEGESVMERARELMRREAVCDPVMGAC